ncbi:helix-turn-helix domain-containing protein [Streptomyces sp. MUM 136J]|uniref:helix-turn-helix domain-containing protein n=1 Tax=Streptomyces sp. MUM 136J TaxID=2791992 RepID=UPI001F04F573|nr:helix-turn-helix transcriptional regulator [Streptomyces sp. MUM 136J]MCH0571075.1 helix-turn-helix domain-containing protein [Streptomyces sp. MUM 136J]
MARPEQRLVRDGTPLRELAFWLRDLRTGTGLTYAQLAVRSGYSVSTLQEAAAGRRLPTLAVTLAFARACGADQGAWQCFWTEVRRAVDTGASVAPVPPWSAGTVGRPEQGRTGEPDRPEGQGRPDESGAPRPAGKRRPKVTRTARIAAASGLLLLVAVGVPGGLWLASTPDRPHHRDFASVVVQNKVAIGPTALLEDKTPAYLSSETISHCAARDCKLTGTEMWSGAKLVVFCWTRGEKLTNEDITSTGITRNEGGVSSDLWYGAKWKDGRTGYFPEVYLTPAGRGGSGLARCSG